jgi:hypothetical protein
MDEPTRNKMAQIHDGRVVNTIGPTKQSKQIVIYFKDGSTLSFTRDSNSEVIPSAENTFASEYAEDLVSFLIFDDVQEFHFKDITTRYLDYKYE